MISFFYFLTLYHMVIICRRKIKINNSFDKLIDSILCISSKPLWSSILQIFDWYQRLNTLGRLFVDFKPTYFAKEWILLGYSFFTFFEFKTNSEYFFWQKWAKNQRTWLLVSKLKWEIIIGLTSLFNSWNKWIQG